MKIFRPIRNRSSIKFRQTCLLIKNVSNFFDHINVTLLNSNLKTLLEKNHLNEQAKARITLGI